MTRKDPSRRGRHLSDCRFTTDLTAMKKPGLLRCSIGLGTRLASACSSLATRTSSARDSRSRHRPRGPVAASAHPPVDSVTTVAETSVMHPH